METTSPPPHLQPLVSSPTCLKRRSPAVRHPRSPWWREGPCVGTQRVRSFSALIGRVDLWSYAERKTNTSNVAEKNIHLKHTAPRKERTQSVLQLPFRKMEICIEKKAYFFFLYLKVGYFSRVQWVNRWVYWTHREYSSYVNALKHLTPSSRTSVCMDRSSGESWNRRAEVKYIKINKTVDDVLY